MLKDITFDTPPTLAEIKEAYKALTTQEGATSKVTLYFSEPTRIQINKRKAAEKTKATVHFFESTTDTFCYSFYSRTGFQVEYMRYDKIVKMSLLIRDEVKEKVSKTADNLLKHRYDDQTWSDLTVESTKYLEVKRKYMKSIFPRYVLEGLEKAFQEKSDYRYVMNGTKRNYSVSTKMGDDGIFRAWFSSEHWDCGHGDYFLLLNPKMATFSERD